MLIRGTYRPLPPCTWTIIDEPQRVDRSRPELWHDLLRKLPQGLLIVGETRDRDDEVIGARLHEPLQAWDDGLRRTYDEIASIFLVAPSPTRLRRLLLRVPLALDQVHRDAGRAHNVVVVATDLFAMLLQDVELVAKLIEVCVALGSTAGNRGRGGRGLREAA